MVCVLKEPELPTLGTKQGFFDEPQTPETLTTLLTAGLKGAVECRTIFMLSEI